MMLAQICPLQRAYLRRHPIMFKLLEEYRVHMNLIPSHMDTILCDLIEKDYLQKTWKKKYTQQSLLIQFLIELVDIRQYKGPNPTPDNSYFEIACAGLLLISELMYSEMRVICHELAVQPDHDLLDTAFQLRDEADSWEERYDFQLDLLRKLLFEADYNMHFDSLILIDVLNRIE
jgi:hypothetical protein